MCVLRRGKHCEADDKEEASGAHTIFSILPLPPLGPTLSRRLRNEKVAILFNFTAASWSATDLSSNDAACLSSSSGHASASRWSGAWDMAGPPLRLGPKIFKLVAPPTRSTRGV